uniref:Helix-turn-helix domain-containing protein n=1 Tax=Candidatus Kentrum eta TaxID=2126337 RepID=A0A450VGU9_9GAMM|nr:MAG: Helix-turn-helix domain-containing protein [Candidatus Kentron sp. H]
MSTYTQLTRAQRYRISALMKAGHARRETADTVGVHKSTITREPHRNRGNKGYRPRLST